LELARSWSGGYGQHVEARAGSIAAVLVALLAVAPAASAQTGGPTRAQYVAQVDPICLEAVQGIKSSLRGLGDDIKARKWKRAARKTFRAAEASREAIAEIVPIPKPQADVQLLTDWLSLQSKNADVVGDLGRALRRGDLGRAGRLARKEDRSRHRSPSS
jgi:hypothetical protein